MFNIHSGHIAVAVLLTSYAVGGGGVRVEREHNT